MLSLHVKIKLIVKRDFKSSGSFGVLIRICSDALKYSCVLIGLFVSIIHELD